MGDEKKLLHDTKKLMLVRYPRFASEVASANFEYKKDLKYHTAATDGKNIYFDPVYLASLDEDERTFLVAHELMHIKFKHALRLLDKNGKKRDRDIWNTVTDAIINANLERDGFKIKEGYVNIPDALKYSAEELYEKLVQEQEKKQNNKNTDNNKNIDNNKSDDKDSNNTPEKSNEYASDDHSLWEEAFKKEQERKNSEINKNQSNDKDKNDSKNEAESYEVNEREEFSENRQERIKIAKENLERTRNDMLKKMNNIQASEQINLGDVGESKESIDWRLLVRREVDKNETIWSRRRSIAENNYAYRLEEVELEDEAETEVMIDVSGSVNLDLVKSFLRMLKPLLKHSKLKVGCFNEKFWGMVEIKQTSDIDNFVIPKDARGHYARTEDWDLAVRSFTKKREINKFVFTDGNPCPGVMPKDDLRNENVIWLVYGNNGFSPCCGKVIHITKEQLERLQSCVVESNIKIRK